LLQISNKEWQSETAKLLLVKNYNTTKQERYIKLNFLKIESQTDKENLLSSTHNPVFPVHLRGFPKY
jgi:hypothetical protein